jgi:hypothetical protein
MAEPRGQAASPARLRLLVALVAIAVCWAFPYAFNLIDLLIALSFAIYIGLLTASTGAVPTRSRRPLLPRSPTCATGC